MPWHTQHTTLYLQSIASSITTSGSSNSFSKVLANFPSQYFFAIGFSPLFSLSWNIPPPLYCTLKQYDSTSSMSTHCVPLPNYWSITIYPVLFQVTSWKVTHNVPQSHTHHESPPCLNTQQSPVFGLLSFSLAVTMEIILIFFSSIY